MIHVQGPNHLIWVKSKPCMLFCEWPKTCLLQWNDKDYFYYPYWGVNKGVTRFCENSDDFNMTSTPVFYILYCLWHRNKIITIIQGVYKHMIHSGNKIFRILDRNFTSNNLRRIITYAETQWMLPHLIWIPIIVHSEIQPFKKERRKTAWPNPSVHTAF